MTPSFSSPAYSSLFVMGAGQPTIASDPPGTALKATVCTRTLDNPETDASEAKPLSSYSIESTDDESVDEGDGTGILKLGTDDRSLVRMDKNVQALRLVNCLFLIHVPEKGERYNAWHIAGMDLCNLLNIKLRLIMFSVGYNGFIEVEAADGKAEDWKEWVQENPGTTYLCGPNADEQAREFFNVDPVNVTRTEQGPVTVTFDIATRSFHMKYLKSRKRSLCGRSESRKREESGPYTISENRAGKVAKNCPVCLETFSRNVTFVPCCAKKIDTQCLKRTLSNISSNERKHCPLCKGDLSDLARSWGISGRVKRRETERRSERETERRTQRRAERRAERRERRAEERVKKRAEKSNYINREKLVHPKLS